jgi:phenylpropionate dioxygenase-like ring-hydroxylating dioxygenase large terminal subunit
MFVRNAWYIAARSEELKQQPLGRILLNEPVVLYRKADGKPVALEDRCCHRRAPLSEGKVEGDSLRCGYHGFLYDAGGKCTWVPGTDRIPPGARVRAYPVVERHRWIWAWMGEAAKADESLIPDLHYNDSPGWASASSVLPVKAGYLLMVENLMDLSHVAFVHINSIGSAEDINPDLAWERGENFARGTRVASNLSPSKGMVQRGLDFNMDVKKVMTFLPPCHVVIDITRTEASPAPGKKARVAAHHLIINSMTPETETTCRYYWANARDHDVEDTQLTEMVRKQVAGAFDEDKAIIEAQQRIVDLDPSAPTINVVGDAGGVHARKIVDRMLAEEKRGQTTFSNLAA